MKDKKLADFLSFNTAFGLRNLAVEIKEKTMATRTNNNRTYYINPTYLTFNENSGYGANLIQVSASSSCWISVYDKANGIGYSDADKNYQRWKVTAYNNKFLDNDAYRIYVRLERNGTSALIVYSKKVYNVDGSSADTEASADYYYIYIGDVSATDGTSIRSITYDTGYLESDQGYEDANELNEMWEWDKISYSDWLISAKKWLSSFTVKGFIELVGGLIFKKGEIEKTITDIKRSTDNDDEVPVSDSTLPTTKYVWEMNDERYLRKDKDDRSVGTISSDKGFEVGKFVAGASGAVFQIDKKTGHTIAELDKLYVRMKAYFETLEIINVNSVGGKMILSPAGAITCLGVDETEDAYRCYFLGEQDGEVIENRWKKDMQAYSQMFNAKEGVSNKVSNVYYWRLVTGVSEEIVEYNNQKCHYIDLSKEDRDYNVNEAGEIIFDSDIPKAGDVINHRGSRTDTDYMNFIEFSSVGTNAPYITLFQGVDSYSLEGKEYVSYGYDQATGRAFMNVYGDMYVGARDGSSFIRYTPETGVEIKARLSVGSTLSDGRDIEEAIKNATPEGYQEFVESVNGSLGYLQKQIDGSIDSYYFDYDPTLENEPAKGWSDKEKEAHLGDTFTNNSSGDSWRWGKVDEEYQWIYIEDTATKKALTAAAKAVYVADGKRRTFTVTPTDADEYDVGDLWVNATFGDYDNDLLKCDVAKKEGDTFDISHWSKASKYTDDSQVNALTKKVDDLSKGIDEFGADLEAVKQQTDREYTIWFENYVPTLENEPAVNWTTEELKAEHDQDLFYYREEGKAWRFEEGEWKYITDHDVLRALEKIAQTNQKLSTYEYLKTALDQYPATEIENGLVMTSLVAVRNSDEEVEAFLNGSGIAKDDTFGKLLLAGGIPSKVGTSTKIEDRAKKAKTRIYEDGSVLSNTISFSSLDTDENGYYILPPINGKYGMFYMDSVIGVSRAVVEKTFVSGNKENILRITGPSSVSSDTKISISNQDTIVLFSCQDSEGNDMWSALVIPYWIYGRESSDSIANIQAVPTPEEATSSNVLYIITG